MIQRMFRAAAAVAAFGMPLAASAQQVPLRDLPKPDREIDDPFTLISSAVEYTGGKLLVADIAETQLTLVDFAAGSKANIGRKGAGPGEYTGLLGIFRRPGDTIWVLDAQGANAGRMVTFLPDRKPGKTFPFVIGLNPVDSSTLSAPMYLDRAGRMYATSLPLKIATARGATENSGSAAVGFADSTTLVRFDPKTLNAPRTSLARLRFFQAAGSGVKQQVEGTNLKMTMPFLGLSPADGWTLFPDGRIAIVRGSNYAVEFIQPNGQHTPPRSIPHERYKLDERDQKLELDAARDLVKEQTPMIRKMLPPGWTVAFELLPPPSWPAEYPAINPQGVRAGPDGRLWVQRLVPKRIDREQWDVIDASGRLVARWQLPPKVTVICVGDGYVYTARTDEDDLKYVQRIALPR